ncbi:hypothetical protein OSTOST_10787, partial [Ostertagia ostertagi]
YLGSAAQFHCHCQYSEQAEYEQYPWGQLVLLQDFLLGLPFRYLQALLYYFSKKFTYDICFIPLGNTGFYVGPLLFNVYTTAAFFMFFISIVSVFVVHAMFVEDYVGIIKDPFLVIPKFDRTAVLLLFYLWWMLCGVASTEGLAAPITIAMYNWTNEEAILYNGIVQVISCGVSTIGYTVIGSTRIGTWSVQFYSKKRDRRLVLAMGLLGFWFFHFCHYPLPFYEGPLTRPALMNSTASVGGGGCFPEYEWCDYTRSRTFVDRVPMALYFFNFAVVQGFAYPLISAPSNTLLSEIIGPRKQGTVQGLFAFTGSMAQFTVPIFSTALFETSGYKFIMVYHLAVITSAALIVFVLRKRLVPLELTPTVGKATKYKRGTFYRM